MKYTYLYFEVLIVGQRPITLVLMMINSYNYNILVLFKLQV